MELFLPSISPTRDQREQLNKQHRIRAPARSREGRSSSIFKVDCMLLEAFSRRRRSSYGEFVRLFSSSRSCFLPPYSLTFRCHVYPSLSSRRCNVSNYVHAEFLCPCPSIIRNMTPPPQKENFSVALEHDEDKVFKSRRRR